MGTFNTRVTDLQKRIGGPQLTLTIANNQRYAAVQERGSRADGTYAIRKRPGGGTTGALSLALGDGRTIFSAAADTMLRQGLGPGMSTGGKLTAGRASSATGYETGVLRGSYSVTLSDGATTTVVTPSRYPRLDNTSRRNRQRTVESERVRRKTERSRRRSR